MGLAVLGALVSMVATLPGQTPVVADGGVLNSATLQRNLSVSPGSLVAIFGTELASAPASAASVPLSTSLANVSVTFNDVPAPLLFVSPTQINAQLPWNVLPQGMLAGTANVIVRRGNVASATKPVQIGAFSPGIYAVTNRAIAINLDGSLAQPAGAIPGFNSHPAKPGDAVILLGSGLGAVDAEIQNGRNSQDRLRNVVTPPMVLVGGMSAPVLFAGLSPDFVGVYQVNLTVPTQAATSETLPIQFQVGGLTSPETTTIAVAN